MKIFISYKYYKTKGGALLNGPNLSDAQDDPAYWSDWLFSMYVTWGQGLPTGTTFSATLLFITSFKLTQNLYLPDTLVSLKDARPLLLLY
jgi:hypothetical protein